MNNNNDIIQELSANIEELKTKVIALQSDFANLKENLVSIDDIDGFFEQMKCDE